MLSPLRFSSLLCVVLLPMILLHAGVGQSAANTTAEQGVCSSTLEVGFDYPGNDMLPYIYNVSSASNCCAACTANAECRTFSYITGDHFPASQFPLQTCILKNAISSRIKDPTVTAGLNVGGVCRSTLDVGFDYPGNDIFPYLYNVSSAEQCCASCSANPACKTFSYITGDHFPNSQFPLRTCVLKSAISQRIPDPTVTTGIILPEKGANGTSTPVQITVQDAKLSPLVRTVNSSSVLSCSPGHVFLRDSTPIYAVGDVLLGEVNGRLDGEDPCAPLFAKITSISPTGRSGFVYVDFVTPSLTDILIEGSFEYEATNATTRRRALMTGGSKSGCGSGCTSGEEKGTFPVLTQLVKETAGLVKVALTTFIDFNPFELVVKIDKFKWNLRNGTFTASTKLTLDWALGIEAFIEDLSGSVGGTIFEFEDGSQPSFPIGVLLVPIGGPFFFPVPFFVSLSPKIAGSLSGSVKKLRLGYTFRGSHKYIAALSDKTGLSLTSDSLQDVSITKSIPGDVICEASAQLSLDLTTTIALGTGLPKYKRLQTDLFGYNSKLTLAGDLKASNTDPDCDINAGQFLVDCTLASESSFTILGKFDIVNDALAALGRILMFPEQLQGSTFVFANDSISLPGAATCFALPEHSPEDLAPCTSKCGDQSTFSGQATQNNQAFTGRYTVSGSFLNVTYDMYSDPDKLQVFDGSNALVYDSGWVGDSFSCTRNDPVSSLPPLPIRIPIKGKGNQIYRYQITSGCEQSAWELVIDCE